MPARLVSHANIYSRGFTTLINGAKIMQAIWRIPQYPRHTSEYANAVKLGELQPGEDGFNTLRACQEFEAKLSESFDRESIFIARSEKMCDGDIGVLTIDLPYNPEQHFDALLAASGFIEESRP